MIIKDKQTKPKPKVKANSMNPSVNKPSVKVPPPISGSNKMKSVGSQPKGTRGSKVERA